VALEQFLLRVLCFVAVSIISPALHIHSIIHSFVLSFNHLTVMLCNVSNEQYHTLYHVSGVLLELLIN